MPFKSDKQRRYLWSQKPEVAKQIAYKKKGGALSAADLNYEDPVLLNELKRKMQDRVAQARAEGIGVTHNYMPRANYRANYGPKTFRANPGSLGKWNSVAEWRPVPGRKDWYDLKDVNINVPLTPSLTNAHTIGEEYAHAKEQQKLDDVHKNTILKARTPKANYAEEMRAKKAADEFIGGHTPRSRDWVDYTRESYRNHYVPHMGSRNVLRAEAENQGVLDEVSYRNSGGWWNQDTAASPMQIRNRQYAEYTRQGSPGKFKDWLAAGGGQNVDKTQPSIQKSARDVARVATPYGSLEDAYSAGQNIAAGNYGAAAGDAALAAAGFLPFVRPAARTIKAAPLAKAALQGGDDAMEYAKLFGREVAGLPDRPARSVGASAKFGEHEPIMNAYGTRTGKHIRDDHLDVFNPKWDQLPPADKARAKEAADQIIADTYYMRDNPNVPHEGGQTFGRATDWDTGYKGDQIDLEQWGITPEQWAQSKWADLPKPNSGITMQWADDEAFSIIPQSRQSTGGKKRGSAGDFFSNRTQQSAKEALEGKPVKEVSSMSSKKEAYMRKLLDKAELTAKEEDELMTLMEQADAAGIAYNKGGTVKTIKNPFAANIHNFKPQVVKAGKGRGSYKRKPKWGGWK